MRLSLLPRLFLTVFAVVFFFAASPQAQSLSASDEEASEQDGVKTKHDRYIGYYYPPPLAIETYIARSDTLSQSTRQTRIAFATGFTTTQLERPYPPQFALFVKGGKAQKLIIISMEDSRIDTIYRARGLLAQMTAISRTLPLFREFGVEDYFTFLDLAKMLGFVSVTVSNGRDFTHQIRVE